jgi:pimeloyl-ACP methyl ester carboxylesterase
MSAVRPIGFLGIPVGLRQPKGPRPIILVHGYAMNRANFLLLGWRLARAGLGPIYGFEYWSLGKTSSAARRLGEYVGAVRAATGADRVDLIGHSMGGMVSRYFVSLGGGAEQVKNLITIGSPHGGTDVSGFGFGRPNRELYPGSSLLERLEAAPLPPEISITAIWSRSDALVPQTRANPMRGVEQVVFDDLGHLSLLVSRRVADEVIARLRR